MKTEGVKKMVWLILLISVALLVFFSLRFEKNGDLNYRPNVACINGSPYGKVLVLMMQDPIETYVHKGTRHEDVKYLIEDEDDEDHEEAHHHHHHHHPGCPECAKEEALARAARAHPVTNLPVQRKIKKYIEKLVAFTHRKTSTYKVTPAHERYLQGVIEDKLRFAYELDPSNNTNYEGLYLYLTIDNLGKSKANPLAAYQLAKRTLKYCMRDQADPASMLTGANAASDIGSYMGKNPQKFTTADVDENLKAYAYCLKRYTFLLPRMPQNGFRVSEARVLEMNERFKHLVTRFKSQKVFLKRVFEKKE